MAKPYRDSANIPPLKTRRRELRNDPTATEYVLWQHLKGRQLLGKKFRRQYSISRYIVDFFCVECDCVECDLAIELDGAPHFQELKPEYEAQRTEFLEGLGVRILRFENRIVHENIDAVLETIRELLRNR
jgi:very-short-patch-repair endonuclease